MPAQPFNTADTTVNQQQAHYMSTMAQTRTHSHHSPWPVHHINSNKRPYHTHSKRSQIKGAIFDTTIATTSHTHIVRRRRWTLPSRLLWTYGTKRSSHLPRTKRSSHLPRTKRSSIPRALSCERYQYHASDKSTAHCSVHWPCEQWEGSLWWVDLYQSNQGTHWIQIQLTRIEPKDGHHGSQGCSGATQGCLLGLPSLQFRLQSIRLGLGWKQWRSMRAEYRHFCTCILRWSGHCVLLTWKLRSLT